MDYDTLLTKKVQELKTIAKNAGLRGYSKLKKDELILKIMSADLSSSPRRERQRDDDDCLSYTRKEITPIAKDLGIKNIAKKNKKDLCAEIDTLLKQRKSRSPRSPSPRSRSRSRSRSPPVRQRSPSRSPPRRPRRPAHFPFRIKFQTPPQTTPPPPQRPRKKSDIGPLTEDTFALPTDVIVKGTTLKALKEFAQDQYNMALKERTKEALVNRIKRIQALEYRMMQVGSPTPPRSPTPPPPRRPRPIPKPKRPTPPPRPSPSSPIAHRRQPIPYDDGDDLPPRKLLLSDLSPARPPRSKIPGPLPFTDSTILPSPRSPGVVWGDDKKKRPLMVEKRLPFVDKEGILHDKEKRIIPDFDIFSTDESSEAITPPPPPKTTRDTGHQISISEGEESIEIIEIQPPAASGSPKEVWTKPKDVWKPPTPERPPPPTPTPPTPRTPLVVPKMPKRSERSIEDIEKLLAEISKPTDQLSNIQDVQKSIFKCLGLIN